MKTFLVIIVSTFFWLGSFEYAGFYLSSKVGDGLDKAKVLLEPNQSFGWLQKKAYEGTFIGEKVKIDSDGFRDSKKSSKPKQKTLRVLTLGPSSAFGWGVADDETYSHLLKSILENKSDVSVEVINASQIGFSSFQGTLLVKNHNRLKDFKPDIVLFAYGVNDIDRHRFYYQGSSYDKESLTPKNLSENYSRESLLNNSHGVRFFHRLASGLLSGFACPNLRGIPLRRVRVSEIVINAKVIRDYYDVPFIILNTGNAYRSNPEVNYIDDRELEELSKKPTLTTKEVEEFKESENSHYWYKLAAVASQKDDCKEAKESLERAKEYEDYRISADIMALNRELLNFKDINSGVFYIDVHERLKNDKEPMTNFVDPIHPNDVGHRIIAVDIANLIYNNILYESGRP